MKTIVLKGPTLTQSGYGVHARSIAKWLLSRNDINVKFILTPWGNTPYTIDENRYDGLVKEIFKRSALDSQVRGSDISIQVQLPNEWNPTLSLYNVGVTAGIETDVANPQWHAHCNTMNKVIVPSEHAKKSLLSNNIVVVPEPYNDCINTSNTVDIGDFSTDFNFLLFGQLTGNNPNNDRKNIYNTIKWICEVFPSSKDVGIVVKTNACRNTKYDRREVKELFVKLLQEVRKSKTSPKLHLIHGDLSDQEVSSLYKHPKIKALVTLTRGEGYGLPILEAAAAGLPVIATNWSGHLDFMNLGKFIPVNYKLTPVHSSRIDNKLFMHNAQWAEADELDFKRKILKFKEQSSIPVSWAKDLQKDILQKYSQEAINKQYNELFKDII